MALLNKLFFPSSSSVSSSSSTALTPAAPTCSAASACNAQTNTANVASLSRTSSLASILTAAAAVGTGSSAGSSAIATNASPTASLSGTSTKTAGVGIKKCGNNNQSTHSKNYLSQFPFDGSQVRILVYRECDTRGRRLLFDSNALEKVYLNEPNGNKNVLKKCASSKDALPLHMEQHSHCHQQQQQPTIKLTSLNNNHKEAALLSDNHKTANSSNKGHSNANFIEVCDEYGYKHNRPNATDIASMGEMVFGALAMSFRGTSLKVHWLQSPPRLLCSQVFLTPLRTNNNSHSPYSTFSSSNLATPRSSICSEHGSIDGLSMNSFSLPFSMVIGRNQSLTPSDLSTSASSPLDVPSVDQQSILTSSETAADSANHRFSSIYSAGTDSGYSGMSRSGQTSSDQWSSSYQYSTRSSLGSVLSEQSERMRKFSIDSNTFSNSSGSGNALRLSSDGSLQRRISRNMMTSFENENSMNDLIGFVTDHSVNISSSGGSEGLNLAINYRPPSYSNSESRSNPEMGRRREGIINAKQSTTRRAKLGLAVCITMSESFEEEMEQFCSEHIALFESMLSRLRASTERAYLHHHHFLQIMVQMWQDTQQWFVDLFTAPRIKCPVWLSITTSGSKYSKNVAERFIKELCWLLSFADTKDTNFFISTMLTAVLTHHLGWVPTVAPLNTSSSTAALDQRAKLLEVSQKHPYNALWAQMGDLFGAIGLPPKLARTVIYGTEKLFIERLLNVITYFIRCGEVRRSPKKEDFNKDVLNDIVAKKKNEPAKKSPMFGRQNSSNVEKNETLCNKTLTRSQTCKQNLALHEIVNNCTTDGSTLEKYGYDEDERESEDVTDAVMRTYKKNEIPNVYAFRDSRFVQQELRIGNYLMDTGIEKNSFRKKSEGKIRVTLTTPDNVELNVDDSHATNEEDGVMEAIEIECPQNDSKNHDALLKTELVGFHRRKKKPFFWSMTAAEVKEGLTLNDLKKIQGLNAIKKQPLEEDNHTAADKQKRSQQLSLSDLITQNSMGKCDRMNWGIEPVKENVSLEEQIHFDYCQKLIEREHGICRKNENGSGVVFVLGDNEPLVNIKRSTEDLTCENTDSKEATTPTNDDTQSEQFLCDVHRGLHNPTTDTNSTTTTINNKKHSGVKFNFEQYPQIVTNYMKSKNLLMTNYDLLMEKCSKLEPSNSPMNESTTNITNTFPPQTLTSTTTSSSVSACVVCNGMLNAYQTPSNATELEFETDEVHRFPSNSPSASAKITTSATHQSLTTVSSQTSVQTLIQSPPQRDSIPDELIEIDSNDNCSKVYKDIETTVSPSPKEENRKKTYNPNLKKSACQRVSLSSVAAKCAAVNGTINLLKLPIPGIKDLPQDNELADDMKLPVGFIPSLFLNVNDHYIPDMVLQGTFAPPSKWEINLREDLALAAHSASFVSLPAENIAIIADMEKWDVKLISSQSQHFPYAGGQSSPVGMSQLVSSMLETVHIMNSAGISAYECLSFMESKLQEIYLHSETLAAFLLETDFCSLSAVTTALNLSENDVPLLLSIASIHTPQISKKCGISFR